MARFIDLDKLIWLVQNNDKYGTITKRVFISLLQNSETEDVVPVVHAHKVRVHSQGGGTHWVVCSHCEKPIDWQDAYCKHCGAIMDEAVE